MIFDQLLQKITARLPQAQAALLLDADGISVAEWKRPATELDALTVSIEYSRLLMEAGRIAKELGHGTVAELTLKTQQGIILFAPASENYYLVLVMEGDRDLGLARYLLRTTLPDLRKEL